MLYFSEFVYGSIDGLITTFSIIAGSAGGSLSRTVILIIGLANVLSDGFSMGTSRLLSSETEIKQDLLVGKTPMTSAFITFLSFVVIGMIPILPFIFIDDFDTAKIMSGLLSFISFFAIGFLKGYVVNENCFGSGIKTLILGMTASLIAYVIGNIISNVSSN